MDTENQAEEAAEPTNRAAEKQAPAEENSKGAGSKEAVLADLVKEREKRQALESEIARLREAAEAVTAERDAALLTVERVKILREAGVPEPLEKFVTGTNTKEIKASAAEVLAAFNPTPKDTPKASEEDDGTRPLRMRPDPSQGAEDVALNSSDLERGLRQALGI